MTRVAGCDPGTSSLDIVVLGEGEVTEQVRFTPELLRADATAPVQWLTERGPFALVAGPSGYGLPLVRAGECDERLRALMSLVRPDDVGASGVGGFTALVNAFCRATLPTIFLPGVIHLLTVPPHRKINRIDMGTADKVCVAALALALCETPTCCVVELGSAFTACMAIRDGKIVDGIGGTSGPIGWRSSGAWDGEVAYWRGPRTKGDLFRGGVCDFGDLEMGKLSLREGVLKAVASLRAITPFDDVILAGRLCETEPTFVESLRAELQANVLGSLPGAWVKHAAQGAAIVADGLAGGRWADLITRMELRDARGSILDHLP